MTRARLHALLVSIVLLTSVTPGATQPQGVIRIGMTGGDAYSEARDAQELGLFKKADLRVDLRNFSSGVAIATGVASGTIDVGIANVVYLARAIDGGTPFVFLAGGGMYSSKAPLVGLIAKRSGSLRTPRDFEGKTIALAGRDGQSEVAIAAWMDRGGADFTKVHFIYIPFGEMLSALQSGLADAALITEPWLSAALKSEDLQLVARPHDAIGSEFLIGVWFTTAQWYAKNRAAAKKFVNVIYESGKWANSHPSRSAVRTPFQTTLDPSGAQEQLNLAYRYHIIKRPMSAVDLFAK